MPGPRHADRSGQGSVHRALQPLPSQPRAAGTCSEGIPRPARPDESASAGASVWPKADSRNPASTAVTPAQFPSFFLSFPSFSVCAGCVQSFAPTGSNGKPAKGGAVKKRFLLFSQPRFFILFGNHACAAARAISRSSVESVSSCVSTWRARRSPIKNSLYFSQKALCVIRASA